MEKRPANLSTRCVPPTYFDPGILYGFTSLLSFNSDIDDEQRGPICEILEVIPSTTVYIYVTSAHQHTKNNH